MINARTYHHLADGVNILRVLTPFSLSFRFFDTNVALSALLWRGTPYRLLQALRQRGDLQLVSSPTLLEELSDVLSVYSTQTGHSFHGKLDTHSTANWTVGA